MNLFASLLLFVALLVCTQGTSVGDELDTPHGKARVSKKMTMTPAEVAAMRERLKGKYGGIDEAEAALLSGDEMPSIVESPVKSDKARAEMRDRQRTRKRLAKAKAKDRAAERRPTSSRSAHARERQDSGTGTVENSGDGDDGVVADSEIQETDTCAANGQCKKAEEQSGADTIAEDTKDDFIIEDIDADEDAKSQAEELAQKRSAYEKSEKKKRKMRKKKKKKAKKDKGKIPKRWLKKWSDTTLYCDMCSSLIVDYVNALAAKSSKSEELFYSANIGGRLDASGKRKKEEDKDSEFRFTEGIVIDALDSVSCKEDYGKGKTGTSEENGRTKVLKTDDMNKGGSFSGSISIGGSAGDQIEHMCQHVVENLEDDLVRVLKRGRKEELVGFCQNHISKKHCIQVDLPKDLALEF